jgi:hypothetical protein
MHSNFITPPDFVETVLIINATEDHIKTLSTTVKTIGKPYNVYFYNTDMNDPAWFERAKLKADVVLDADLKDPTEYFNK